MGPRPGGWVSSKIPPPPPPLINEACWLVESLTTALWPYGLVVGLVQLRLCCGALLTVDCVGPRPIFEMRDFFP